MRSFLELNFKISVHTDTYIEIQKNPRTFIFKRFFGVKFFEQINVQHTRTHAENVMLPTSISYLENQPSKIIISNLAVLRKCYIRKYFVREESGQKIFEMLSGTRHTMSRICVTYVYMNGLVMSRSRHYRARIVLLQGHLRPSSQPVYSGGHFKSGGGDN